MHLNKNSGRDGAKCTSVCQMKSTPEERLKSWNALRKEKNMKAIFMKLFFTGPVGVITSTLLTLRKRMFLYF